MAKESEKTEKNWLAVIELSRTRPNCHDSGALFHPPGEPKRVSSIEDFDFINHSGQPRQALRRANTIDNSLL